jgi:uncharacterized Rmd1/YagE family protein
LNDALPNSTQFEELISSKIEETKDIPEVISETGKIGMPHKGLYSEGAIDLY